MKPEMRESLRPLLESSEGVHLTAYVENRNRLEVRRQLQGILDEAYEWLNEAMSIEERAKFLEPIDLLVRDNWRLEDIRGNLGLFRTKDTFRVLNLPVEIKTQCHVATSFHVKPLLRWMQLDREFYFLGLTKSAASLWVGNFSSVRKLDSLHFGETEVGNLGARFRAIKDWMDGLIQSARPKLFVVAEGREVRRLESILKYRGVVSIASSFDESRLESYWVDVRANLREEAKRRLELALIEYQMAEDMNLGKKNIFQIARAAVKGKVMKLIVADGVNIFGKIDQKTGGLALHPYDMDHEDDDVLDDLAQAVLSKGGEVIVAPRDSIPKGRPILAILKSQVPEAEKFSGVRAQMVP